MNLHASALRILFAISALLGVDAVRPGPHADQWTAAPTWVREGDFLTYRATSVILPQSCRDRPSGVIEFPQVIQGAHEFYLDGRAIGNYGDPTFKTVEKFYGRPVLKCAVVAGGTMLSWKVTSFADYFARINDLPTVTAGVGAFNLFAETFHTIAAGAMIVMAIYTLFLFYGPVSLALTLSVFGSAVLLSLYFASCASDDFGLGGDMLTLHKFADTSLWFGMVLLFNAYRIEGLLNVAGLAIYVFAGLVGFVVTVLAGSGDEVQLGTTLPVLTAVISIAVLLTRARTADVSWFSNRQRTLQLASLLAFSGGLLYEIFTIGGVVTLPPLLPLTITGGVLFLIISVNQRIRMTYQERDHLRANLQAEVDLKTKELTKTLGDLRTTQAELVQSAKLASLGTLAAGIAHEINNSLNFVNGAIVPLQRILARVPEVQDNHKVHKLFGAMNEGMRLSIEIIASLRNFTGLNQAKYNDVVLNTVIQSVLTILKQRVGDRILVKNLIPADATVFGSVVGLNQVFMNLISNAIDAMPNGGVLEIGATEVGGMIELYVRDSGSGMPAAVAARIFEPFFTTKDVGKGTGLGLHIVKGEIEKHHGRISVHSAPGEGTTFKITLPKTPVAGAAGDPNTKVVA